MLSHVAMVVGGAADLALRIIGVAVGVGHSAAEPDLPGAIGAEGIGQRRRGVVRVAT
jgi:hypothetical protein